MNFNERGDIPSCSALGRIKECGGSWALSRGVEDTTTKEAEAGQDVHDCLKQIVLGGLKNPKSETEMLAWRLWDHIRNAAFNYFGEDELVWKAEERLWMSNEDLEPILSGQFDVICYRAEPLEGDPETGRAFREDVLIFDAKTGWQAGDVPNARQNAQMQGLGALVEEKYKRFPLGSIVREWAADEPEPFLDTGWVRALAQDVHEGQYDVWHRAGLRTGSWCQFCPAKGNCPAYRESLSMVVSQGSSELTLETMSPENLVRILKASPMADKVIEAAKKEAQRRRLAGKELPGVIWAKGNVKRTIKEADKIMMRMKALGIEVPTKIDVKLSDIESAYGKVNNIKGKALKEKFNKEFSEFLEFSENAPSIEFAE